MGRWGKFDFTEFKNLAKSIQNALDSNIIDSFMKDFLLEMAFRAERKIKRRTPVGQYPAESGMVGGLLRRGWEVGEVKRITNGYEVEIFNNTEYAPYVEYGHRQEVGRYVPAIGKRLRKPWVEGRFMMTISMQEIERELPIYLERRMTRLMKDILNGRTPRR